MLIREYMTPNPITVRPDTTVPAALRLMRDENIRRLPVLDDQGLLVGIVSDKDLLYASPSPATTLAMWEIPDLLAKIRVGQVMSRNVITISVKTPLEEAARVMADNKVGGLPVMQGSTLVGIITETDLFKQLLELLGGRRSGVRIAVAVADAKGRLAEITNAIFEAGGNIVGLGVNEIAGSGGEQWEIVFKIQGASQDDLVATIRPHVGQILDVREMADVS
ncbi:MAG: CBS domain-containing protein [Chloroflexota bacterium]